jgi:hypothetical protein
MQNYAKVGGVLSIVAGALGVFWMLAGALFASTFMAVPFNSYNGGPPERFFAFVIVIWIVMGLSMVAIGVLAIVGGVYALKQKYWGLALAGAVAGTISFFPCGIPAIIFVSLGKPEFVDQVQKAPVAGGPPQSPAG